jgi:hypothetical protein
VSAEVQDSYEHLASELLGRIDDRELAAQIAEHLTGDVLYTAFWKAVKSIALAHYDELVNEFLRLTIEAVPE